MSLSTNAKYFVPDPSKVMIWGSGALFCLALGSAIWRARCATMSPSMTCATGWVRRCALSL